MRSTVLLSCVVSVFVVAGCAARHPVGLADRFIHEGKPAMHLDPPPAAGAPQDSLAEYIDKVRELSLAIRPASGGTATSIEASNAELAAALQREAARPSAETHREVGEIYRKLGVLDMAYSHFALAIKADNRDAAAYDGMARVWRDWGFPGLGLGDAHRAIYFEPGSPSGYNTLGTILQALGQPAEAISAYRRALALAPDAPYALNNVCSALLAMRRPDQALAVCQRAVQLDPSLVAAQRNLAAAVALNRIDAGGPVADAGAPGTPGESLAPPAPQRAADAAPRDAADRAGVTERAKVYPTADVDRR